MFSVRVRVFDKESGILCFVKEKRIFRDDSYSMKRLLLDLLFSFVYLLYSELFSAVRYSCGQRTRFFYTSIRFIFVRLTTQEQQEINQLEYHKNVAQNKQKERKRCLYLRVKHWQCAGFRVLQCLLVSFGFSFVRFLFDFVTDGGETSSHTCTNSIVRIFHLFLMSFVGGCTCCFCKNKEDDRSKYV